MAIKKGNVKGKFTIIPNTILERSDLSWSAKGLLAYLISKPPNWMGRREDLLAHDKTQTKYSLRKIIKELQDNDYLNIVVKTTHGQRGLLGRFYELKKIDDIETTDDSYEVSNFNTSLNDHL